MFLVITQKSREESQMNHHHQSPSSPSFSPCQTAIMATIAFRTIGCTNSNFSGILATYNSASVPFDVPSFLRRDETLPKEFYIQSDSTHRKGLASSINLTDMTFNASVLVLGGIPALCMLLCTLLGFGIRVPSKVEGALQHFAAGVLLSAIATELVPTLTEAKGLYENLGLTIGFIAGMGILIVLRMIFPDHDSDEGGSEDRHHLAKDVRFLSLRQKTHSMKHNGYEVELKNLEGSIGQQGDSSEDDKFPSLTIEGQTLLPASLESSTPKAFPTVFLVALLVDSCLDGLLIGIAAAAGPSAGPMMAASLSVEMSFLGLTLATALHGLPLGKSIAASIAGPIVLMGGAVLGGLLSSVLQHEPAVFAGLMGFGTSALLFMVAEELLLEAHEEGGDHIWWVDLQLYTGFYVRYVSGSIV
jgi:zinc transporter ZupT